MKNLVVMLVALVALGGCKYEDPTEMLRRKPVREEVLFDVTVVECDAPLLRTGLYPLIVRSEAGLVLRATAVKEFFPGQEVKLVKVYNQRDSMGYIQNFYVVIPKK